MRIWCAFFKMLTECELFDKEGFWAVGKPMGNMSGKNKMYLWNTKYLD